MKRFAKAVLASSLALSLMAAEPREAERRLNEAAEVLESARRLSARGDTKATKTRLEEAESIYRSIVATNSTHREATLGLSAVLFMQERYQEGLTLMRPLQARLPNDLDVKHQYALHLYRAGERSNAVPFLEEVAQDPKRFDAAWLLLQDYYTRAEWARGVPVAERYLKARPDDSAALGLIGTFYLKVERFEEALGLLERSLKAQPENKAVAVHRANALFRLERLKEAGEAYEALLVQDPKQPHYLYNLASVRMRERRFEEALPLLERFLAGEPTHGTALYFRVDCLVQLQRFPEARQAIELALKTQRSNPWLYFALSRVSVGEGLLQEALTQINGGLQLKREDATLLAWRGNVQRRLNSLELALIDHQKAVELAPKEGRFAEELGLTLYRMSRFPEARQAFEKAHELSPNPRLQVALATSLALEAGLRWEQGGKDSDALLTRAVELAPERGLARAMLALKALQSNQIGVAQKWLDGASSQAKDADWQVARAWLALTQQAFSEAEAAAVRALEAQTSLAYEAWMVRGHVAGQEERWEQAVVAFEQARVLKETAVVRDLLQKSTLELAFDELARGQASSARQRLVALEKQSQRLSDEERGRIRLAMGALDALGQPSVESLQRFSAELDSPRFASQQQAGLRDLGQRVVAYGALKMARADLARAALAKVKQRNAHVEALELGVLELQARDSFTQGRYPQAIQEFASIAAQASKLSVSATQNEAAARFMAGERAQAGELWQRLLSQGELAETFYNLANWKGRQGEHKQAFELFQRAAKQASPLSEEAKRRAEHKGRIFGWRER